MAIWLTTGLPGHGKTLRTVVEVEERRIKEGRRVYYHGINDLTLDWFPLDDPTAWMDVPDGSIIVIDEAQQTFPNRANGSAVPEHVAAFETHRHHGLDIVLITQHPKLIDAHVRRLIERHQHVMRPFGYKYSVVLEWQVCTDPDRSGSHKMATKTRWRLPSEAFGVYKSATVHTVKPRLPGKALMLPILGAVIGLSIYYAKVILTKNHEQPVTIPQAQLQAPPELPRYLPGTFPKEQEYIPVPRPEPLSTNPQIYIVGQFNDSYIFQAIRNDRTFYLNSEELIQAGYYFQPLTPCLARLTYRESVYYLECKGTSNQAQQDRHTVEQLLQAVQR